MADLKARLSSPGLASPASWTDGHRVRSREEFLQMLDGRLPQDEARVVIVQPHVSKAIYDRLRGDGSDPPEDLPNTLRLSALRKPDRQNVVYAAAVPVVMPRSPKRACIWMRRAS